MQDYSTIEIEERKKCEEVESQSSFSIQIVFSLKYLCYLVKYSKTPFIELYKLLSIKFKGPSGSIMN